MRRRFLLVSTALSSATLLAACRKEPVPPDNGPMGNPKGSFYDAGAPPDPMPANPKGSHYDDNTPLTPTAVPDAAVAPDRAPPKPLPGNPKGSHYDDRAPKPLPTATPKPSK